MILYTINGVYPDKNFNFSIQASDLGLVPAVHTHTILNIYGLEEALAEKAPAVHSHTGVSLLSADEEPEFHSGITLQGEEVSGRSCTLSVSGQTITIDYASQETGNAGLLLNANPQMDQGILQVTTADEAFSGGTERALLRVRERTLDVVTPTIDEFIKSVRVSGGTADVTITSIRIARKLAGGLQVKEVWPMPAARLAMTTNYDFFGSQRQLLRSAYSGPAIVQAQRIAMPLQVTVTPYPEDACWKLGHSDNIADSTFFNTVYTGTQTVTVPFSQVNSTGEWEDTWISAYPAADSGTATPVKFRFWSRQGEPAEGSGDEIVAVAGEDPIPAAMKWTFNGSAPLVDVVSGKSLATEKNDGGLTGHLSDNGPFGASLKSVMLNGVRKAIIVDGRTYTYSSSLDQPSETNAKYAWYDINTNAAVYTASASPVAGDATYSQDGTDTGYTVSDVYEINANYWETATGLDTSGDLTFSFYMSNLNGGGIKIGFKNLIWGEARYSKRLALSSAYGNSMKTDDLFPPLQNNWFFFAISLSREMTVTDPSEVYTTARGYGFIVEEGYKVNNLGFPYVRDPVKDKPGYYAFSWISGGISNNDTCPQINGTDVPTVWSQTESPPEWSDIYDAEETKYSSTYRIVKKSIYHLRFQDDRYSAEPFVKDWYNSKADYDSPVKNGEHFREIVYFVNGTPSILVSSAPYNTVAVPDGGTFFINLGDSSGSDANYISDVRVYNRMLTMPEITYLRNVLWSEEEQTATTAGVKFTAGDTSLESGLKKIHVANGWYIYKPEATVYDPTPTDLYAADFAWELLDGTGAPLLYTKTYPPTTTEFCMQTPGGTPEVGLRVTEVEDIAITDYPLHCRLVPFVIDAKTVAVAMWTHDAVIRMARSRYPNIEGVLKRSETEFKGSDSYKYGDAMNLPILSCIGMVQKPICDRADDISNWSVDGGTVSMRARFYETPFMFTPSADELQWRNCRPGDDFYASEATFRSSDRAPAELIQIAYLTLPEAMVTGSTHTIQWCGDTCTVEYGPEQYCATIKVNQEGYLPFSGVKRYAYLGRWMGTDTYMPDVNDRTFYVVPSGSTNAADAVFSGTMTQRCVAGERTGLCSDQFGWGNYPTKPLTGENVFEMDFSNLSTVSKVCIVAGGTTYWRDTVEDWTDGSIEISAGTTSLGNYRRSPEDDTCNAYAWRKTPSGDEPALVYTDTHFPDTTEQARSACDADESTVYYSVDGSTQSPMYGWTTERTTAQDYTTAQTVRTSTAQPETGATAVKADGTTVSITGASTGTTADISGEYQIYIPNIGWSISFLIHPQAVFRQFWVNMRGLFHQRLGCQQVGHPYTNWVYPWGTHERMFLGNFIPFSSQAQDTSRVWRVDPETHEDMLEYGARQALGGNGTAFSINSILDGMPCQPLYDVYGGWGDAADFDAREFHLPIISILSAAYILEPDNFEDGQLDLPESGDGIPDILSEALWGMELYRRAQRPDGAVSAWFEASGHESTKPWLSNKRYYKCCHSQRMSMQYAAPAARLARALRLAASRCTDAGKRAHIEALAKTYTESACAAFEYGRRDQYAPYMKTPDDEREPIFFECQDKTWAWLEDVDTCKTDGDMSSGFKAFGRECFLAATALYALTRESRYLAYLSNQAVTNYINEWKDNENEKSRNLAFEFASDFDDAIPLLAARVKTMITQDADGWLNRQRSHPYRWLHWEPGHSFVNYATWGTSHPDTRGFVLTMAYRITGDAKYRNGLLNAFDHICGCNPLGRSWVPWIGKVFPNRYLDHWLPDDTLRNGYESARPGVTPDIFPTYPVEWKTLARTVGLWYEGRTWLPEKSFDAFPAMMRATLGMNKDNWREKLYFTKLPYAHGCQTFGLEPFIVDGFEFTVDTTIAIKAALTGMLMGPGCRPKPWYKQISRIKREDNLGNLVVLP